MAFESAGFVSALAAAAGDDLSLLTELRESFRQSVAREIDLLGRARCDGNWRMSALRLRGLAASFHASDLLALADEAVDAAPGEPVILRSLRAYETALAPGSEG